MKSLLQQAKEKEPRSIKKITQEYIDLAIAWATNEVSLSQIEHTLYGKSGGAPAYVDLARSLKQAFAKGQIKVVKKSSHPNP